MRIYLTGFMGSGKSRIGRLLAQHMKLPFLDLDEEIERSTGRSIAAIFEEKGEDEFRKLEKEYLEKTNLHHGIVATGGGCFIHNRDWMLKHGKVVYLHVPFSKLVERIGADQSRPLWKNAEILFAERESIYKQAHHEVDASASPTEVVEQIAKLLRV